MKCKRRKGFRCLKRKISRKNNEGEREVEDEK
jgi:hypothetical protein